MMKTIMLLALVVSAFVLLYPLFEDSTDLLPSWMVADSWPLIYFILLSAALFWALIQRIR